MVYGTHRRKIRYYHCRKGLCAVNLKKHELETKFYEYLKSFEPTPDALAMFKAVVLDVWKNRQAERIKEEFRIEKELKALEETQKRIDELMINGTFDEETYKKRSAEIRDEILVKKIELNEARIELNDVEACVNYCVAVMSNIANLWANADLNLKQRFQTLIFPKEIYYKQGRFRTTETALIFKQLQQNPTQKSDLVATTGLKRKPSSLWQKYRFETN